MKPSYFLIGMVAVAAIAGCNSKEGDAATNTPLNITPIAAPAGGDWAQMVTATPEGGFLMGNPNAKVKVIEYGSMTCPHCREFEETGAPQLVEKYVKTGQVSFEFRNYVRDAFDLTASLIARCNGPKSFFPLTKALYEDQPNWVQKVSTTPPAQLEQLQGLPPSQQFAAMAKIAGFQEWAAMRGVPQAKSSQCLADENSVNQLVQMASDVTTQFPEFDGTPEFIINGKVGEGAPTWANLEPQIRSALGS